MKAPETSWLRENQFRSEEERISRGKQFIIRRVDILDGDLESIKCTRLCDLDLFHEENGEIFEDDAIGCGEEGKNMTDEVAFVGGKILPVWKIGREINFLGSPKRGFGFLVHFPYLWVLDWEHAEAVRVGG